MAATYAEPDHLPAGSAIRMWVYYNERITMRSATYRLFLLGAFAVSAPPVIAMESGPMGANQPHSNMQPILGVNHIIALQGLFPGGGTSGTILGEVGLFAGNFAPGGWAFAEGQILPINGNQALFSLLGTTYGGDGRMTFALPDLRGRTAIHPGTGPNLTRRTLGSKLGVDQVILTGDQSPVHHHTLPSSSLVTGGAGGNASHSNMMPSLGLNHTIALNGVYQASAEFLGEVSMFAGNFAPRGEARTDGQLLPISQNTALFSLLGTTYGGDGRTDFALPDLRGRTAVHRPTSCGLRWQRT